MKPSACCAAVLVATSLVGCVQDDDEPRLIETSISKLRGARIAAIVRQNVMTSGRFVSGMELEAVLEYSTSSEDGICRIVPGLEATLGSTAVAVSNGAFVPSKDDSSGKCEFPKVRVRIDDLAKGGFDRNQVTLTLRDASGSLSVNLGNALVERTAELVSPPSGGYRPGDAIEARWSPASDLLSTSQCSLTYEGRGSNPTIEAPCTGTPFLLVLPFSALPFDGGIVRPSVATNSGSVWGRYSTMLPVRVVAP